MSRKSTTKSLTSTFLHCYRIKLFIPSSTIKLDLCVSIVQFSLLYHRITRNVQSIAKWNWCYHVIQRVEVKREEQTTIKVKKKKKIKRKKWCKIVMIICKNFFLSLLHTYCHKHVYFRTIRYIHITLRSYTVHKYRI